MGICHTVGFLLHLGGWNTPILERELTLNDYMMIWILVCKQPGHANDTRWIAVTADGWKLCSSFWMDIFPLSWTPLVNWNAQQVSRTISPTIMVPYMYIPNFEGFSLPKQQAISNLLPATAKWDIWRATIQLRTTIHSPISRNTTTWCCLFEDFKDHVHAATATTKSSGFLYCGGKWLPGVYSWNPSFQTK